MIDEIDPENIPSWPWPASRTSSSLPPRFFHQTFAEWVIARYLAEADADRTDFLARLAGPVQRGHLGPILVQLLYTLEEQAEYRQIVGRLTLDDLLSLRAVAHSAVTHGDLTELLPRRRRRGTG
ncbi:hypothetical protein [Amycolatopsis sp. NPDC051102]|uniref:hypothetical protein n=1 Tax=Amycolatopsis sp. NPDC051102 TaxID=3155163 RepID=UPI0034211D05